MKINSYFETTSICKPYFLKSLAHWKILKNCKIWDLKRSKTLHSCSHEDRRSIFFERFRSSGHKHGLFKVADNYVFFQKYKCLKLFANNFYATKTPNIEFTF